MPVPFERPEERVVFVQSLLRTSAITLCAYDFLRTLPCEWRFARRVRSSSRWKLGYLLYMGVRYLTLFDLALSTMGFFSGALSNPDHCYVFIFFVRYIRCATASCASAILGWRAYAIALKRRAVAFVIVPAFVAVAGIQIWSQSYSDLRIGEQGQCFAANPHPQYAVAFYAMALAYDLMLCHIATSQLWKNSKGGQFQPFTRSLIKEGLLYYAVCTVSNVVNVIMWSQPPHSGIQSVASNLGLALTSIMTQGLMISLIEITIPRDTTSEEKRTAQRQRERKFGGGLRSKVSNILGNGPSSGGTRGGLSTDGELSVKVQVDVLHTFDEAAERDKRRDDVRPAVRGDSDEKKREYYRSRVESEPDTTTTVYDQSQRDLELGPVSPVSPREMPPAHVRYAVP